MINNFLIISCIGQDDRLGLQINKDFFIHNFKKKNKNNRNLVSIIFDFLNKHNVQLDANFSVIVNQGPGSFSGIRVALAVAKGLEISKKVKLFGYKNSDLSRFDRENIQKLFSKKLFEKKLIKPIYLS
mgnify:CR=1 FL=1|tara:strand:- start:4751 stop:5134 length:384 start_codon:yes stop_codon:yes gene_type:complete